jgi:hypothetical protein
MIWKSIKIYSIKSFFVTEDFQNRQAIACDWKHYDAAWQTLSRSYGRCIAEFLNEESLVRLGLLDLSTCVGLRYGQLCTRV